MIFSTQKNLCDSGIAKAAVGAKVMTESVAFDTSFDMASQRYNAGLVYGGKASSSGVVSGCFKTTVDGKMTFSGCLSVDCKNLSAENNRVGFGVEYLF